MYGFFSYSLVIVLMIGLLVLPPTLATHNESDAMLVGLVLCVGVFVASNWMTLTSKDLPVDRSEIEYARFSVGGEQTIHVKHKRGSFETSNAFIYNNFEDTSKVKVVIEKDQTMWMGPYKEFKVKNK